MKKNLLALLMALVMLVSCVGLLAGCGGNKAKDLVGTWVAEMDMTEGFKATFADEMVNEMASAGLGDMSADDLFDLTRLNAVMEWKMVMNEDGSMTMSLDAQKMADSLQDVMNDSEIKIKAAIPTIMEAIFAQQGMSMSDVEALLAAQGMSMDDMVDEMGNELSAAISEGMADINSSELNVEESGYYTVNGDKLYVVDNKGDKPNPDEYLQFELKGDELVVTDMPAELREVFGEMEEMAGGSLLPLTFKRG